MSGKHSVEHAFVRFDSVGNRYVFFFFPGQAMQFMFGVGPNKLAIHFLQCNLEFIDKELHWVYPSPLV